MQTNLDRIQEYESLNAYCHTQASLHDEDIQKKFIFIVAATHSSACWSACVWCYYYVESPVAVKVDDSSFQPQKVIIKLCQVVGL